MKPETAVMPAMTGRTVLHYRIGERLGAGGMGEVYRARDLRLERDVAVKFVSPSLRYDAESRARLIAEARAAAAIRSPHIAAVYDIEEHDHLPFIVMEFVRGEVLSRRIARGRIPPAQAAGIASQVAAALEEAHGLGLVHRDIKSGNIMLEDGGLVKVLDFGLAKYAPAAPGAASRPTSPRTAAGIVLGTIGYMSPEQLADRPLDGRSDLFSLGVVLYEMLSGALPFTGGRAASPSPRIVGHGPPSLPGVPFELQRIVSRALASHPEDRYPSARELRADLDRFRNGDSGTSDFTGAPARASSGISDRGAPDGSPHRVAVLQFANITGDPADDWIGVALAETVTSDLRRLDALTVIGTERVLDALKPLEETPGGRDERRLAMELGRRVGATCIVTGGYQRQGETLRVTARFVHVQSGTVTGTVKADGPLTDIFVLQDRIVHGLSRDLELLLQPVQLATIGRPETISVQAYELHSRGLVELRRAEPASLDRAASLFEQATDHDPSYAAAWAALGGTYVLKAFFSGDPALASKAMELAGRALALDPRLPAAHLWLGVAHLIGGRYAEAVAATTEALRLDPASALAHAARGRALAWTGDIGGAVEELRRAVRLDPTLGYAHLTLALLSLLRGELQSAEDAARRAVQVQTTGASLQGPSVAGAHMALGLVHYRRGRYEEALREYEHERAAIAASRHAQGERVSLELDQRLAAVLWRLGRRDAADVHFARAARASAEGAGAGDAFLVYGMAALLALRGEPERALDNLDRAFTLQPVFVRLLLETDPDFDPLREDPRVHARWASSPTGRTASSQPADASTDAVGPPTAS